MGKTALHVLAKRSTPHFAVRDKEREREKRKKILKMCVQKLRDIDDPETVLCRAVLINNTFKTLKYTHRHIYRPEPEAEPVYEAASEESEEEDTTEDQDDDDDVSTDESSNSDDESIPTSSSDNESDIDNDSSSSSVPILPQDNAAASTYCQDELDNNFNSENCCDIKSYAATDSIVHSLMMPPLLSPQIEDITNCSFYDSFSSTNQDSTSLSDNNANKLVDPVGTSETEMTASFRFTVVDSNLDDSTTVSNGFTPPSEITDYCQKSYVQSDIGNSMLIDNLLTEIVQA